MRILVIILSSFAGQILVFHAGLILRLNELVTRGADATEAVVWVSVFGAWTLATALVYTAPSVAGWLFASAGALGLAVGASTDNQLLIVWGGVASGLAVMTTLARREQRVADQAEWHREQQDLAVYLAMRSLQETVPELLTRVPDSNSVGAPPVIVSVPNGLTWSVGRKPADSALVSESVASKTCCEPVGRGWG